MGRAWEQMRNQRLFPAFPDAGGAGGISLQLTALNGFGAAVPEAAAGIGAPAVCGFGFFMKLWIYASVLSIG